jgi:hypothetical protein
MEPYDLVGAVFRAKDISVKDWRVSHKRDVAAELGELVQEVRARISELHRAKPIQVLTNPDFELPPQGEPLPGWIPSRPRPDVTIRVDAADPKRGQQCLHMRVDDPKAIAWVRSKPFRPPRTGRVFVLAWIRTRDRNKQPPLRLAVDNGQQYYRFAPLGIDVDDETRQPTGQQAQPLSENWPDKPFLLAIDDLPSAGMTELLIGFDLMGEGEVWIDDVQVFDLYFQTNERDELLKNVYNAASHLRNGRVSECTRYLDGYWPRFLLEYVPPPARMAVRPDSPQRPGGRAEGKQSSEPRPESSSWSRLLPRLPFRLPFQSDD